MTDFVMPSLGADMETGAVVEWLVAPGSRVKPGDVVAVVETHKGAIDVEIFLDGVIDDLVPLGTELPVGALLARVRAVHDGAAEPVNAPKPTPAPAPVPPPAPSTPAAGERMRSAATDAKAPALAAQPRAKISPAARQRALALGIDPARLRGTGFAGSVTLGDVAAAATPTPAPATTQARVPRGGFDAAQMRQAIGAAMSRSKREIPHYYLNDSIDFGAATAWLETFNRSRPPDARLLPAVLLLKATAVALRAVPQLNGHCLEGEFRAAADVHIGWAVALRGGGLVAPAIHHADRKPLPQLMQALRDLVQRARAGGLRSSELTDPTVTVTSLGERGAESVLGVIYPPQVAIVGFGRVTQRPWCVDGQIAVRPVLAASLAADHRVSDGHLGGRLLAAINEALQHPEQL